MAQARINEKKQEEALSRRKFRKGSRITDNSGQNVATEGGENSARRRPKLVKAKKIANHYKSFWSLVSREFYYTPSLKYNLLVNSLDG